MALFQSKILLAEKTGIGEFGESQFGYPSKKIRAITWGSNPKKLSLQGDES